jgi:manganese/iron transport system substrate-binding protein
MCVSLSDKIRKLSFFDHQNITTCVSNYLYDNDYHYCNKITKMTNKIHLSYLFGASVIVIATSLTACNSSPEATQPVTNPAPTTTAAKTEALPQVVATNTVVCDIAKQIAADTIDLKCLMDAGTDSHVYEPKPDDRKAIEAAKLVLYSGYNFETNLIKLIQSSSNLAPKVATSEVAVANPLTFKHDHDEKENKDKKEADPHVWHDAQNGIKIAQSINKSLIALRPDRTELYKANTAKLVNELTQIDTWIKTQIATIPPAARKLVTTHDALGYYAKAYNIPIEGALGGINTKEQPTTSRLKELVKVIKDTGVPTIFAEITINPKLITTVATEAGVKVAEKELFTDGLGEKGSEGETYTGMLISNTKAIVEGLGGKYTPFQMK